MLTLTLLAFGTILALLCLVAVPIIIVGVVLGAVLFLLLQILLLPFRLLGWAIAVGAGGLAVLIKLVLLIVLGFIATTLLLVMALPVLPLLLIGAGIWLAMRARRRAAEGRAGAF